MLLGQILELHSGSQSRVVPELDILTRLKTLSSPVTLEPARVNSLVEGLFRVPRLITGAARWHHLESPSLEFFAADTLEFTRNMMEQQEAELFRAANPIFVDEEYVSSQKNGSQLLTRSGETSTSQQKKRKRLSTVPMLTSQELKNQLRYPHRISEPPTPVVSEPSSPRKESPQKVLSEAEQHNKERLEKVLMKIMKHVGLSKTHPEFKDLYKQLYTRVKFEVVWTPNRERLSLFSSHSPANVRESNLPLRRSARWP